MLYSVYPFHIQTDNITCAILKRKDDCDKNIPYSIFSLSYNNFSFQTCLPYSLNEKSGVKLQAIPFVYPMAYDFNKDYEGMRNDSCIDLSSKDKMRNQTITYTVTGDLDMIG
jgi:hypothetical protein